MADDLKVLISWPGPFAKAVASELRDWLRNLTDRIDPWMSDVDIEAGSRSMDELASELNDTNFGIVIVTQDNQRAPWLNFEAGALSKQVGGAKSRVVPLLMDMTTPTDLTGPLSQYQAQLFKRSGVSKMVQALAAAAGVDKLTVAGRLEKLWPDLERAVDDIRARNARRQPSEPVRTDRELLDETLTRVRSIERRLEFQTDVELMDARDHTAQPNLNPHTVIGTLAQRIMSRYRTQGDWVIQSERDRSFVLFAEQQDDDLLAKLNSDAARGGLRLTFKNAEPQIYSGID